MSTERLDNLELMGNLEPLPGAALTYTNGEAKMKVRVLKNYQDTFRKVHLVNDLLEIDSSQFDARLHSEEVETKQRATNSRKRTKKTEPIKDEADV